MGTIFQLLESCSSSEKNKFLQYISVNNAPNSKKYRLLKLMIDFPHLPDQEYAKLLYQKSNLPAFAQLKKRLTEELLSIIGLVKKNQFQKKDRLRAQVVELVMKAEQFFNLSLEKEGVKALKKALYLAGNQGYTDLILCVHETARSAGVAEPIDQEELQRLKNALCKQLELTFHTDHTEKEIQKSKFISVRKSVLQTESNNEVLNLLEKTEEFLEHNQISLASEAIQKAESILYSYPSIHQPEMIWKLNLTQQQVLLKYGAFEELIQNCQRTLLIKELPMDAKSEVYKNEWFASFYLKKTKVAKQILLKLARQKKVYKKNTWQYFESFLLFQEGDLEDSLILNHECQRNLKGIPEFYLGSKLLEIMILIEKNEWDWVEFKLESFRKTLYSLKGKVNCRIKSFFNCLQLLQKTNPDCFSERLENHTHFQLLQSAKDSFSWQPGTYELIPYHRWISHLFTTDSQPKNSQAFTSTFRQKEIISNY
ncbi:hypothetical protein [Algoriphagus halophilus]|uniref:Uncharacterized protein n=1 Tax=Algoriphagus halophilus TaxID=226505 RepID=A0A1N6GJV7_9BACT|nr:hypothetical protein [Algoriphagus halophilus]SIO07796.1 hypothetical protein SAMN05444394_3308 [Algoriphagus halophilus]